MSDNPYATPHADLKTKDPDEREGSVWKGVLVGLLVDIGGTLVFSGVVGALFVAFNFTPDLSDAEIEALGDALVRDAQDLSTITGLLLTALGTGMSLLGSYVTGRIAKARWRVAAVILVLIHLGFGLWYTVTSGFSRDELTLALVSMLMAYAGAWLGGHRFSPRLAGSSASR